MSTKTEKKDRFPVVATETIHSLCTAPIVKRRACRYDRKAVAAAAIAYDDDAMTANKSDGAFFAITSCNTVCRR